MNKEYIFNMADGEQMVISTDNEAGVDTENETGTEAEVIMEESIYSNIKEEAASFPEALQMAWQGMLGIFIVALIIIVVTSLLNAVTSKKNKKAEI